MNDEQIRQIASEISRKVLEGRQLAIVFPEANESLRHKVRAEHPATEFVTLDDLPKSSERYSSLLLVAPSLDFASRLIQLQTDHPVVDLVVRALYAGKRVQAILSGMLSQAGEGGLLKAIGEMRERLKSFGIEFQQPDAPDPYAHRAPALRLPVVAEPHPSRLRLKREPVEEFVEFLQSKQCHMEKGKPCDQCDMCNTLGF